MSFTWEDSSARLKNLVSAEATKAPLPPSMTAERDPDRKYQRLDVGQQASLLWIAEHLPESGLVLADEVGTGKTRIACAVVHSILDAGGRAAVVVPHGLIHQWQREARVLGLSPAKEFTSVRDFIEDAKETKEWEKFAPSPNTPEWLLVSHGFRAPQVRQSDNPAEWRVALPSYVCAVLAPRKRRDDARTKEGRLLREPHQTTLHIAEAIASRIGGKLNSGLRKRLTELKYFRRDGNNADLINELQREVGRGVVEGLLGLWLGQVDLLVIDEAHKSRDDDGTEEGKKRVREVEKVLPRLLDNILIETPEARRLCLTATPMELDSSQWLDLLKRARCNIEYAKVEKTVMEFQAATKHAATAPDETARLKDLERESKAFEAALKDVVTRRRRAADQSIRDFGLAAKTSEGLPHPHRRLHRVQIAWADTVGKNSPWLDVLFVAECMSQSATGLNKKLFEAAIRLTGNCSDVKKQKRLKHLIRDMYARLASGHLSADIFDADVRVEPPDDCDAVAHGKLLRTEYWRAKIQKAMKNGLHEDEHPRILAAVKEIEGWTRKHEHEHEKVLVFGVFLRPLQTLADVLNVRQALRDADQKRPSALNFFPRQRREDANEQSVRVKRLLGIALSQLERMRAEGALSGRLATGSEADMRRALKSSHDTYEGQRKKVRLWAKKAVAAWRTDTLLLGGVPIDGELERALRDHLVSFVLDDFLATTSESDKVTNGRFAVLSDEFVKERLRPLLGELRDEDVDTEQAALRQKSLRALLEDDDGRQCFHARLLQGATRWETRRYLQAAFNRPGASPWVLIAQSQVGREGLNLHESCRVVVQFHAEWNPAVLEQQIGRVDRKGSLWEQRAQKWIKDGARGKPPFIEVRQLIFDGTYDAFQWDRVMNRQREFDASLFGSLLPPDAVARVPANFMGKLRDAAPDFCPPSIKSDCLDGQG